jgi:aspartyl-tRNA(Asn)/glutamyl-tRNA(Gln) amidotransferase subunit C
MALAKDTVYRIGRLARIHVGDEEADRYADELSRILDLVEQMNDADTERVEPLAHPQDRSLRLREDEITEADQREAFQGIAPAVEAGLYLVPKVIE